ncbi:MAG: PAS domain S-box protein [Pseudodesulfovibrio sp.]|nr:PAS domain S-box protein [Pseudodesulfovibrio sp.]
MKRLKNLLISHENQLVEHTRANAKKLGHAKFIPSSPQTQHLSIAQYTAALIKCMDVFENAKPKSMLNVTDETNHLFSLAIEESSNHRKQGNSLSTPMGLLKSYRQAYLDCVLEHSEKDAQEHDHSFVIRFFEGMELTLCRDWAMACEQDNLTELKVRNQTISTKKNKYLILFESLSTPAFLLDENFHIEAMNFSATEFLGLTDELAKLTPLKDVVPWLGKALAHALNIKNGLRDHQFDISTPTVLGMKHFNITISDISDTSDKFTGFTVVLDDITSRIEMERQLARERNRATHYLDIVGSIIVVLDASANITLINRAGCRTLGYTETELLGQNWISLVVPPEQKDEVYEVLHQTFSGNFMGDEEHVNHVTTKRGENRLINWKNRLLRNKENIPIGILSSGTDVTEQRKAEQILEQSEEKFRRIFETIEESYITTDLEGTITMVNPATCALLGYKESDLIGANMEVLYSSKDERKHFRSVLAADGNVRGFQLTASHKNRSKVIVETNAHILHDEAGIPIAMEGTFRDITARIEAEKILREKEKLYRSFFENNHAIMLLVDPKTGSIVDANPAACLFYGHSRKRMRTMHIKDINAQSEKKIYQEMVRATQQKRAYFIFKHKLANGKTRDVEVYSGPIMVHGSQLLYSVIHDITKRIRLERKMKRLATTDTLTGADNRHQFFLRAAKELTRAKRYDHPLTVLMLDIDYFKSINDTHGHQTGDVVLKALTAMSIATLRETDIFGRIGGEEFAAVLPETGMESGLQVAERLRKGFSKLKVHSNNSDVTFTVSIGVALARDHDQSIEEIINRSDEALYKAKRMGRNRVEHA